MESNLLMIDLSTNLVLKYCLNSAICTYCYYKMTHLSLSKLVLFLGMGYNSIY